jgi:hypothetical protein
MNLIVSAIVLTGVILLICVLLRSSGRGSNSETPQVEGRQRSEDENRRSADEPAFPSTERNSRLTQLPEPPPKPEENVTTSARNTPGRSHCPACGALITATDETCPSCEITFVSDGSQNWTLGNVGPADGICLPPTDVRE